MRNGQPDEKLERIQKMISEGAKLIKDAKRTHLCKTRQILANPGTSSEIYWTLINTILNKAQLLMLPPLSENGLFITDSTKKTQIFNDFLQCILALAYFNALRSVWAMKFPRTLLHPFP